MAIRYKKNCKSCVMSQQDPKFRKRVYDAAFMRNDKSETLKDIAEEYGLYPQSVYNHAKKHIRLNAPSTAIKTHNKINRYKAEMENKLAEVFDTNEDVSEAGLDAHERALNDIIALGAQDIKAGRLKLTTSQFLAAIKIKSDIKSKNKDRQAELVKTMYKFASGEKNKPDKERNIIDGTAELPATDADRGEDQPGSIYQQVSGDATPFWPAEVSTDAIPGPATN